MLILVIILVVSLLASIFIGYAVVLHLLNLRNKDKEQYSKSIEYIMAEQKQERDRLYKSIKLIEERAQEQFEKSRKQITSVETEAMRAVTKANEQIDQAQAKGKQEGKRDVLSWIKQSVDEGTLEVRVVGEPKIDVVSTPTGTSPFYQPAQPNPNWQPSTLE